MIFANNLNLTLDLTTGVTGEKTFTVWGPAHYLSSFESTMFFLTQCNRCNRTQKVLRSEDMKIVSRHFSLRLKFSRHNAVGVSEKKTLRSSNMQVLSRHFSSRLFFYDAIQLELPEKKQKKLFC